MAQGPRLELRQSQSLVMTTQLQQSIKLLQLSALELNEFLEAELEQNPLLSRDDGDGSDAMSDTELASGELEAKPADTETIDLFEQKRAQSDMDVVDFSKSDGAWDSDTDGAMDAQRDAMWSDEGGDSYSPSAGLSDRGGGGDVWGDGESTLEQSVSETLTLRDHLLAQLPIEIEDPTERLIGLHLIDLVDERGYVPDDLSGVTEALSCELPEVVAVLKQLQHFDPPGVCARNLAECLGLQLREKDRFDPTMEKMLQHLDLIATGDRKKLAKLCGVEEEDIPFMLAEIRELNPKPGLKFGSDVVQPIIPDVFLKRIRGGGWQVELNPDSLPRVLVNRQYFARISGAARRKEDKKYLSEQLAHANWLIKAVDQRAQTILKVAIEIVRQQDAFFRYGVRYFKPLVLRDIAAEIDMHESTVSRVTTQKYLSTGNAVYELKYFFSSALGSRDGAGDQHSSEAVKDMIRELIENEKPDAILSDDTIAEMLKGKAIDIARRTVAKYREAMDYPSSSVRRREKKRHL